jgi:hypothetical protein
VLGLKFRDSNFLIYDWVINFTVEIKNFFGPIDKDYNFFHTFIDGFFIIGDQKNGIFIYDI